MDLSMINSVLEFIIGSVTVGGFLWAGWKVVVVPIKKFCEKISRIDAAVETINHEILPVIQSLNREFSKNSGKSIMDRILRIDDNTRLAELRSKLIASNLFSTGMIEFDKSGGLVWCNKAFQNICGLDFSELQNNGWIMCIDENERERVWSLWKSSIQNNIPFDSEFCMNNQQTNQELCIKCTIFPHKSVDGSILGYYGTIAEAK